ncbi:MAG: sugar phosphate isomerase/epimerase [Planctomycetaceae bacterium]|nr:sugar phosphate isomerase/epimerase [Planctomycetaceae bacterium]
MQSRRHFLGITGVSLLGLGFGVPSSSLHAAEKSASGQIKFNLGLASYTTRNFDQATTIQFAKRAGLNYLCFKEMHLNLDASDEECAQAAQVVEEEGLQLYGAGVIQMSTADQVENAFRYAKAARMNTIVGVPDEKVLDLVDQKVKETGIYLAIHNHGPGDKKYPTPQSVYEKVKHLDPRIGLCIDVGHTVRIGADPMESIRKYKDRLFDLHIKDVTQAAPEGTTCICGRGVIDLPAVIATLKEVGYDRVVSFEYEAETKDPLPGLMESVGYIRGVIRMM